MSLLMIGAALRAAAFAMVARDVAVVASHLLFCLTVMVFSVDALPYSVETNCVHTTAIVDDAVPINNLRG